MPVNTKKNFGKDVALKTQVMIRFVASIALFMAITGAQSRADEVPCAQPGSAALQAFVSAYESKNAEAAQACKSQIIKSLFNDPYAPSYAETFKAMDELAQAHAEAIAELSLAAQLQWEARYLVLHVQEQSAGLDRREDVAHRGLLMARSTAAVTRLAQLIFPIAATHPGMQFAWLATSVIALPSGLSGAAYQNSLAAAKVVSSLPPAPGQLLSIAGPIDRDSLLKARENAIRTSNLAYIYSLAAGSGLIAASYAQARIAKSMGSSYSFPGWLASTKGAFKKAGILVFGFSIPYMFSAIVDKVVRSSQESGRTNELKKRIGALISEIDSASDDRQRVLKSVELIRAGFDLEAERDRDFAGALLDLENELTLAHNDPVQTQEISARYGKKLKDLVLARDAKNPDPAFEESLGRHFALEQLRLGVAPSEISARSEKLSPHIGATARQALSSCSADAACVAQLEKKASITLISELKAGQIAERSEVMLLQIADYLRSLHSSAINGYVDQILLTHLQRQVAIAEMLKN